jgi:hypothetical protein
MAMTANAGRQPSANEEPTIGSLLGVEGKAVTHFIQSSNDVGVVAGTRRKTWCARRWQLWHRQPTGRQPDITACCLVSADPPHYYRTEAGRYREGQSLPERDKRPEFGVERVQIWQRVARRQAVLIDERCRLEAPVALERK